MENTRKINHLGVIMDGNRRWAKKNGLSTKEGHSKGIKKLSELIEWCIDFDIKYVTVYAFSTENWKRDKEEVDAIMSLLKNYLDTEEKNFNKNGVKLKVIGIEDRVEKSIIEKMRSIEKSTENNSTIQLNIAFNYGGRTEILDVVRKISSDVKDNKINIEDIDEEMFKKNLYYGNMVPDPDLIIRASGECRVSNFLLWELAYSELCFPDTYWPAFSKELLIDIINDFSKRERRYGGTIKK